MNTPSTTVQAAQQLLAEREAALLMDFDSIADRVDRSSATAEIQRRIEHACDLLLYLIRLRETMRAGVACRPIKQPWKPSAEDLEVAQSMQDYLDRIPVNPPSQPTAETRTDLRLAEAFARMIVCDICGNKRCPHAQDKGMQCTDSNDVGQVGVPIERPSPAASAAANEIADKFSPGFFDNQMVSDVSAIIDRHMKPSPAHTGATTPAVLASPAEDPERAAYLARWKGAPFWAEYRTTDGYGCVRWWMSGHGTLGCEPRPDVQP
jgi:hypothetical protein